MGVIINTPPTDKWKKIDEVSATGTTGTSNSKTVSIPSDAKELLLRIKLPDGSVLVSTIGFVTDPTITARYAYFPNSATLSQYLEATLSGTSLIVGIRYLPSGSGTVFAELYYR